MPAVTRADLVLHTGFDSDNSGTGGSFSIHRILKPWDLGTNYASLDSDGDPSLTPIAELIANGFIAPASTETGQIGEAATLNLDVTDMVQAWKNVRTQLRLLHWLDRHRRLAGALQQRACLAPSPTASRSATSPCSSRRN